MASLRVPHGSSLDQWFEVCTCMSSEAGNKTTEYLVLLDLEIGNNSAVMYGD